MQILSVFMEMNYVDGRADEQDVLIVRSFNSLRITDA
jgi:hypothetical protein